MNSLTHTKNQTNKDFEVKAEFIEPSEESQKLNLESREEFLEYWRVRAKLFQLGFQYAMSMVQKCQSPDEVQESISKKQRINVINTPKVVENCNEDSYNLRRKFDLFNENTASTSSYTETGIHSTAERSPLKHSDSEEIKEANKASRIRTSMSQNYKGAISRGFARILLSASENYPEFYITFLQVLEDHKNHHPGLHHHCIYSLEREVLLYIRNNIQGKVSYTTTRNKQAGKSKISNVEQIMETFFPSSNDSELTMFVKRVVFKMLIHFLESPLYYDWIQNYCQSTINNQFFLIINLKEIKRVFGDPLTYKPRFKTIKVSENDDNSISIKDVLMAVSAVSWLAMNQIAKHEEVQ